MLANLNDYASQLVEPLQDIAVASLGVLGNVLIVLILSLYMVIDRDRILSFLFRLVPPRVRGAGVAARDERRLLVRRLPARAGGDGRGLRRSRGRHRASRSASITCPLTSAASGVLMAIPFFGPFVAWLPPVLVAIFTKPDAILPALFAMGVGWFIVMNVVQPRLMEQAVGIHPIVVLGSVLIGAKIAGISGAIFGIPIAAVISAFFFHYLGRTRDGGPVAARAARRVADREGRRVQGAETTGTRSGARARRATRRGPAARREPRRHRAPTRTSRGRSPIGPRGRRSAEGGTRTRRMTDGERPTRGQPRRSCARRSRPI